MARSSSRLSEDTCDGSAQRARARDLRNPQARRPIRHHADVDVSQLSFVETARIVSASTQHRRRFLDFVVDGTPLYPVVHSQGLDLITDLSRDFNPWSATCAIRRLLGVDEPDAPHGRVCFFVCPECGDLGCGAITARITHSSTAVSWSEWGYQNNYEPHLLDVEGLPDRSFEADHYTSSLKTALRFLGVDEA